MRITVHVKPGRSKNEVLETEPGVYTVSTSAKPEQGKANIAVIKLLAKHFNTAPGNIKITLGKTSREKIVDIEL